MFDFDKAVGIALRTWYPKDHELHLNPHHPLGKLTGEWGELLDDCMKSIYKPGYEFNPLDELGDIWYYIRILAYQRGCKTKTELPVAASDNLCFLVTSAVNETSHAFLSLILDKDFYLPMANNIATLIKICKMHNITLQQLTESNWEKLKPGSERSEQWIKARG